MYHSDYYREQADYYRLLAASAENDTTRHEYMELAVVCDEAADESDDRQASG